MQSHRSPSSRQQRPASSLGAEANAPARRPATFRSGRIRVEAQTRSVLVDGQPAKLSGRAFDLLEALMVRRDRVVSKQELLDVVWPGLIVEENNLQVHVMNLRKALGADAIVTVSGRGYQFALVQDEVAVGAAAVQAEIEEGMRASPAGRRDRGVLIGREKIIAAACSRLLSAEVRLLTLSGMGGVGKTRVGLHVAATLAPEFHDGSYTVMLAPVRDPAHVAATIASGLNVREVAGRSLVDELIAWLVPRSVLLVLDNFEHVLVVAPLVAQLLEACSKLKVLVTSRIALKLSCEHQMAVPPLPCPAAREDRSAALTFPAVQLFLERARDIGFGLADSVQELDAAVEVCRRLDGLPLAIELAAARLRVLSARELSQRLVDRLALLKSHESTGPDRQKTLRSALAWSHELLPADGQALFRRLSVFVGGWSLAAVEAVGHDDELGQSVIDILATLLDHSLIQRTEDLGGESRFAMLETVREFASELLRQSGEEAAVRTRHAEYYTRLAEAIEPRLMNGGRAPWIARLKAEYPNLRSALSWSVVEQSQPTLANRLTACLPWMWYFTAQFKEGRAWIRSTLSLAGNADSAATAKLLSGDARLAMYSGAVREGIDLSQRAVGHFRATGDRSGLALALVHHGTAAAMAREFRRAFAALEEATALYRELGDEWGTAFADTYLGSGLAFSESDDARAEAIISEGRARFRALGDDWGLTTSSHYLGSIALRRGDFTTARELTNEMLTNARELGDNYRISRNLHQLAEIDFAAGSPDQASRQLRASIAMTHEQGRGGDLALQLRLLARIEAARQRPHGATRLYGAASRITSAGVTMPPDTPQANEAALASLKLVLGDRVFQEEWTVGATMSLDRMVEETAQDRGQATTSNS